jgi:Nuclear cap-binding protein subunit 3
LEKRPWWPCPHLPADLLEEKKEVPMHVPRRPEAVYLYGVDVMSSRDCLSYFDEFGPAFVEWINDSSCNVRRRNQ